MSLVSRLGLRMARSARRMCRSRLQYGRVNLRSFSTYDTLADDPTPLAGKTAVITGAGGGIGEAVSRRYLEEGANVVLCDLNKDAVDSIAAQYNDDGPVRAVGFQVDVSDEAQVVASVNTAVDTFGGLDIVMSNAGFQYISPLDELSVDMFRKMVDVHLVGSFLYTREAFRVFKEQNADIEAKEGPQDKPRGGKIMLMGSIHSKEASVLKSPYVAAKHGVLGLARTAAKEGGPHHIAVHTLCPGYVDTPLVRKQIPEQAATLGISEEEVVKNVMLTHCVDNRFTQLQDVTDLCVFLATSPCNTFTGQSFNLSHGWRMD